MKCFLSTCICAINILPTLFNHFFSRSIILLLCHPSFFFRHIYLFLLRMIHVVPISILYYIKGIRFPYFIDPFRILIDVSHVPFVPFTKYSFKYQHQCKNWRLNSIMLTHVFWKNTYYQSLLKKIKHTWFFWSVYI